MTEHFPKIALQVPRILLPAPHVPLSTWAVVACDQHTSHPDYWGQVARLADQRPSTLNLVLPEVYLEGADRSRRIQAIGATMTDYLHRGILVDRGAGFVLVDRRTPRVASRKGLMVALDLECYHHDPGARTLIRTTEGTVLSRLPPRVEIRRGAALEVPHIMVLIDDPGHTVIEPLFDLELPLLYDTPLMLGGGQVRGWHVARRAAVGAVATALGRLLEAQEAPALLYAMGDGNHSFAAARQVWEGVKQAGGGLPAVTRHPARYALVELVNLHDDGLVFEPIHRVLFDIDVAELLGRMQAYYRSQGSDTEVETCADRDAWARRCARLDESTDHHLPFAAGLEGSDARYGLLTVHRPTHALEAVSLQEFLTGYERRHSGLRVDYIHGDDAAHELGARPGNVALLSQTLDKHALFATIRRDGPLPRKSFSLGEAPEKRYYMECRRILP